MTFGTAGLRSAMGAGFCYINDLTVIQSTQASITYIIYVFLYYYIFTIIYVLFLLHYFILKNLVVPCNFNIFKSYKMMVLKSFNLPSSPPPTRGSGKERI
jgi:hypothetical protein